jgi:hypothetical protein
MTTVLLLVLRRRLNLRDKIAIQQSLDGRGCRAAATGQVYYCDDVGVCVLGGVVDVSTLRMPAEGCEFVDVHPRAHIRR